MTAPAPPPVPLSDYLGPQRREALLRRSVGLQWGALLLFGALLLGTASWLIGHRGELGWLDWLLAAPASLLCGGLFCLFMWAQARRLRRVASRRLLLAGGVLIIEDRYDRREIDLAAIHCEVRLAGGAKSMYRPVMYLRSGPDDLWPVEVDLCEPDTRAMRSRDDLLLLADALQRWGRPESHDAAGRLRTLSGWTSLPQILRADPDSIPITPPGSDPPVWFPQSHR